MKNILRFCIFIILLILINISSSQIIKNSNILLKNQKNTQLLSAKCQPFPYSTVFTKCQMIFDKCNFKQIKLITCYKKQCQRFIRGSECNLQVKIQLTQTQCYKECCGSKVFSPSICQNYNILKQKNETLQANFFIAILIFSSFILLGILIFFLLEKQKCCLKNSQFKNIQSRSIIKWKIDHRDQVNCDICNSHGATLLTPYCFQQQAIQKDFPQCPKCQNLIRQKIKVSCKNCNSNSFKIRLAKIQLLSSIIQEAQTLHTQACASSIQSTEQLISDGKL